MPPWTAQVFWVKPMFEHIQAPYFHEARDGGTVYRSSKPMTDLANGAIVMETLGDRYKRLGKRPKDGDNLDMFVAKEEN